MNPLQFWRDARASFWFVPTLCVLAAVVLAITLVLADRSLRLAWMDDWPLVFGAGASGARSLLATLASSMITVVGVVFSITIVALSLTSSQYTPRVLRNFMRDRGNQFVLGAFVGIFAYCLIVLRTIRDGEDGGFVSSLAVLGALLLAFVGIGVLIYFIHHIASSIQAAQILAAVTDETLAAIEHLFPKHSDATEEDDSGELNESGRVWHELAAKRTGYLQSIDIERLAAFAAERRMVVRMKFQVGQFVTKSWPLMCVLADAELEDEARKKLESLVAIGRQRTVEQDVSFGIRQIVDVALKALSPGINDTTSAVMCVNYLTAILAELGSRRIDTGRRGDDGEMCVLTGGPTYDELVAESFDQIRQNASGNVAVLQALLGAIGMLAPRLSSEKRRRALREHARALEELCDRSVLGPRDRQMLFERSHQIVAELSA